MRLHGWLLAGLAAACYAAPATAQQATALDVKRMFGVSDMSRLQFAPIVPDQNQLQMAQPTMPNADRSSFPRLFRGLDSKAYQPLAPPRPLGPAFSGPTANGVTAIPKVQPNQSTFRAIQRQGRRDDRRKAAAQEAAAQQQQD